MLHYTAYGSLIAIYLYTDQSNRIVYMKVTPSADPQCGKWLNLFSPRLRHLQEAGCRDHPFSFGLDVQTN